MKIKTVGLFGLGRFGRMAFEYLNEHVEVRAYDIDASRLERMSPSVSFEKAAESDLLLLTVPISAVRHLCQQLSPLLKPGQVVVDTCSVKERPVQWMLEELTPKIQVIGTHPLFGPDSGKEGIAGMKIAVCPVRVDEETYQEVIRFLNFMELVVIETTAEEHDRQIAQSQAIFHLIAQAMKQLEWGVKPISTPGPETFYRLVKTVQKDTDQLFLDMLKENPYAAEYRERFIEEIIHLDRGLKIPYED